VAKGDSSFYNRFVQWVGAVGRPKVEKSIISNSGPITKFIEWVNHNRATTYYSKIPNSSKRAKYRKKTNTQRTKERSSYIRASEFGGKREEDVISQARGEMSKKTINELTSSFFDPSTANFKVFELNKNPTFDILTSGILEKFGAGQLPKGTKDKWDKATAKVWIGVGKDMARDGF